MKQIFSAPTVHTHLALAAIIGIVACSRSKNEEDQVKQIEEANLRILDFRVITDSGERIIYCDFEGQIRGLLSKLYYPDSLLALLVEIGDVEHRHSIVVTDSHEIASGWEFDGQVFANSERLGVARDYVFEENLAGKIPMDKSIQPGEKIVLYNDQNANSPKVRVSIEYMHQD